MSAIADFVSPAIALDHLCRQCCYNLQGNATGQCPECGTPYSANDPRTFYERQQAIRIREVGFAQKWLIWSVLASGVGLLLGPLLILAIPLQLYSVFRLARATGHGIVVTILLMLLMLVPLVSLIVLLVLNITATSFLRGAGIRVGFMGANASDLPPDLRHA